MGLGIITKETRSYNEIYRFVTDKKFIEIKEFETNIGNYCVIMDDFGKIDKPLNTHFIKYGLEIFGNVVIINDDWSEHDPNANLITDIDIDFLVKSFSEYEKLARL